MKNNLEIKPKTRCAVYTRKSSEEGLEQEFNSLDAQRLAGENFIASQTHEGWVLNPEQYNDGGFSGGNIERPALQRLFKDIREKKIDCVVVYKIDRLTRSLFDFQKVISLFDEYKVSFVSVTQSFNTSNSMGRLMLNVLLSFAQYEREITSERIRDKIDASKKKGMWMGGTVPLGYDTKDAKLILNETEVQIIKNLFSVFIKTESVNDTARELNRHGFTTKSYISKTGNLIPGKKFNKQNVRRTVENPIYIGKVEHKGKLYDGLHQAIISEEIWDKAKEILNRNNKKEQPNRLFLPNSRLNGAPLLKGLIYCGICGCHMTPTYTKRRNLRYRYYYCTAKAIGNNEDCKVSRVSATEVENVVVNRILKILNRPEFIKSVLAQSAEQLPENVVINSFRQIEKIWDQLFPPEQARIIHLLIKSVEVKPEGLNLKIFKSGISLLTKELNDLAMEDEVKSDEETLTIFLPLDIKRRGGTAMILVPKDVPLEELSKNFDDRMIKTIARAQSWKAMLDQKKVPSLSEVARIEKLSSSYVSRIFDLNFLSPKIIKKIMDGVQPRSLKLQDLISGKIPCLWEEQEQIWGFGG